MRLEWEIYRNVRRVLGETEERDQIGRQGTEVVRRYEQAATFESFPLAS